MNLASDLRSSVTGVVLAGGRGLRMNGVDKGLIEVDGRTLAGRQLEGLRPQVAALIVSANRNIERYVALGAHVVADAQPDFPGPLAGMAAAAAAARTEWVVCVPCDTDTLPHALVARLVCAALRAGVDAAYAEDADGGPQYVICALRTTLADALAAAAASARRAVRDFLQSRDAMAVRFEGWRCANLNTPEALAC